MQINAGQGGNIIKRYVMERALISLKLTAVVFAVPFLLSLFALPRQKGYLLLLMTAGLAAICFLFFTLPCIRFAVMIRRQEKMGYSFEAGETCLLSKNMTGTYLGSEWLILAGSLALHYTQCRAVRGTPSRYGRRRYSIIVETVDGKIYKWPLSQRNVKKVRDWLKEKTA